MPQRERPTREQQNAQKSPPQRVRSAGPYYYRGSDIEKGKNRSSGRKPGRRKISRLAMLNRVASIALIIVIVVCVYSLFSLSNTPQVILSGSAAVDNPIYSEYSKSIKTTSEQILGKSVWNLNKLTVNTQGLTNKLFDKYPEFSDISVELPLVGRHPVIYVVPSDPSVVLVYNGGSYLLNQDGVVIQAGSNPESFSNLKLPTIQDDSGVPVQDGFEALTPSNISFIKTVMAQLSANKVPVSKTILPVGSDQLDVYVSGVPYFVKFNLESSHPLQEVGGYMATSHYLKGKNITPQSYIDVRVEGRVYYK